GARWVAGTWAWTGTTWSWTAGGWIDSARFGDAGGEVIVKTTVDHAPPPPSTISVAPAAPTITVGGSVSVPTVTVSPAVNSGARVLRDHRARPTVWRPAPDRSPTGATVRDHRNGKQSRPRVRDHR
nr:hypothetical protein [Deltaproteobacteria bacterium]